MEKLKNNRIKKVIGIGEVVLDKSYILSNFPREDTKVEPQKVKYSLGGPVAAALIVLSRLGADCTFVTSIGDDRDGKLIARKLRQECVRVVSEKKGQTKTNIYLINQKNGSRTGIKSEVKYAPLKKVPLDVLSQSELIITDRHEPVAFEYALKNKQPLTKVIVDTSTEISEKTLHMLKNSEIPILPLETLSCDTVASKILLKKSHNITKINLFNAIELLFLTLKKPIILTAGSNGSFYYDGMGFSHYPALSICAVDALGAGDVYRAGIAWGLLNDWNISECIRYANLVSGLQCTRYGNGSAIPLKKEIEVAWENPRYNTTIDDTLSFMSSHEL